MHPFKDGEPVGDIYVGSTYIEDGENRDVNENKEFDFVFVDERNVLDKAVFEGTKMIAHP